MDGVFYMELYTYMRRLKQIQILGDKNVLHGEKCAIKMLEGKTTCLPKLYYFIFLIIINFIFLIIY